MSELILKQNDYEDIIDVPLEGVRDAMESDEEAKTIAGISRFDERILNVLIPQSCINKRTKALAREIMKDYGERDRIDILTVMTGAVVFASDLARELYAAGAGRLFLHFVKTKTYISGIKQSGETKREVSLVLPPEDVKGRDLIIIEDIVDQGFTLSWLCDYLKNEAQCSSIKICTLLNKKLKNPPKEVAGLREKLYIEYSGFFVKDRWISGYGIDTDGEFRHLPFIVTMNEEYYK